MSRPGRNAESILRLELEAHVDRLKSMRERIGELTRRLGFAPATCDRLVLAVHEACANVIRHAYGHRSGEKMILEVFRDGSDLVFVLQDFAECVDCSKIRPRSLEEVRPGGLGINLIDQIMDSWEFVEPDDGVGNVLVMKKQLPEKSKKSHVKV